MHTVDIVLLVTLIIPGLVGVLYGFLNIVFSIIAWLLAFAISIKFSGTFSLILESYIDTVLIRNMLAFAGLFIISLVILTAIGYFIVKLLGRTGLTAVDRMLGFFLGIGLGGFIITAVVFLAGFTAYPKESWWQSSVIIQPFEWIAIWGQQFLPENVLKYHSYEITGLITTYQDIS